MFLAAAVLLGCSFSIGKPHCTNVNGTKQCFATKEERDDYLVERQRQEQAAELTREQQDQREQLEAVEAIRDAALERQRQEKEERARREAEYEARRQAEQQKREDEKNRREQLRQLATQKDYAVPIMSAMLCQHQEQIASYNEDMKREQRLEASSGVRNLTARREIAEGVDDAKLAMKELKGLLRSRFGASPESCGPKHHAILECHRGASCTDAVLTYSEIWRVAPDVLTGE
jgi:hypothetical protein